MDDPLSGEWSSAGKMANRRFNHAAVRLGDGRVLVAGGAGPAGDCTYTATAELFDPATSEWTTADPMATPRGLPALVLLPSGFALAAGGLTLPADCRPTFAATATAELYDPAADRWTATGAMASARRVFGHAPMADGSVLVAGGRNGAGALLNSAERYDPVSGAWTSAGSMAVARVGVVLTPLADGRVLATGGGAPSPVSSAELYTPKRKWSRRGMSPRRASASTSRCATSLKRTIDAAQTPWVRSPVAFPDYAQVLSWG